MVTYPHCKINIGLNITERRPDGYHNLRTIFYPIPLCDELSAVEADEDSLAIDGIQLDGKWQDNLVMKTLKTLREHGHQVPPQHIRLVKHIPCGAGLGGGSSDAAFMMRLMNDNYQLGLTDTEMEELLAPLGADCPFFVRQSAVYAEGIGNVFSPIELSLRGWHFVLIKPSDHISTREAYGGIKPGLPSFDLRTCATLPVEEWEGRVVNDFEASVFPSHPAVAEIKALLYRMGAVYAAMSGSGSSVFGLFRQPSEGIKTAFGSCFTFQTML